MIATDRRYHVNHQTEPFCCFVGHDNERCPFVAEWEIHDSRDNTPDQATATHACTEHVGALLGDSMNLAEDARAKPGHFLIYGLHNRSSHEPEESIAP